MPDFTTRVVTRENWSDFEELFGVRGACGGCWCMWWRLPRSEFEKNKGEGNRKTLHDLVQQGRKPGLLIYDRQKPIGWVCVGPREEFRALERSRVLARVDNHPVWSVVCFFIAKGYRRQGVSKALLAEAVSFARQSGANIVEGYPLPKKDGNSPDPFVYTGLEPIYEQLGFEVVIRRGKISRGIWRKNL